MILARTKETDRRLWCNVWFSFFLLPVAGFDGYSGHFWALTCIIVPVCSKHSRRFLFCSGVPASCGRKLGARKMKRLWCYRSAGCLVGAGSQQIRSIQKCVSLFYPVVAKYPQWNGSPKGFLSFQNAPNPQFQLPVGSLWCHRGLVPNLVISGAQFEMNKNYFESHRFQGQKYWVDNETNWSPLMVFNGLQY